MSCQIQTYAVALDHNSYRGNQNKHVGMQAKAGHPTQNTPFTLNSVRLEKNNVNLISSILLSSTEMEANVCALPCQLYSYQFSKRYWRSSAIMSSAPRNSGWWQKASMEHVLRFKV